MEILNSHCVVQTHTEENLNRYHSDVWTKPGKTRGTMQEIWWAEKTPD